MQSRNLANAFSIRLTRPVDPARHPPVVSLMVALTCVAAAAAIRGLLSPMLGLELPYLTFFAGVMAAAWFGGWRAGVVATAASALAAQYFFVEPLGSLYLPRTSDRIGVVVFSLVGVCISVFAEALHRTRRDVVRQYALLRDAQTLSESLRGEAQARGEQLRLTLMSIGDAVIVTDRAGAIERMNSVAERVLGRSIDECLHRDVEHVVRLVVEGVGRAMELPVRRAMAEGRIIHLAGPAALLLADGRELPIEDSASPIIDASGQVSGCVLVFRDVSARRAADAAARAREAELSDLFDNANVGLRWVDANGVILRANDEELHMLGYDRSEYVGRHIGEFHQEPEAVVAILGTLRTGKGLRGCATRMVCKDGGLKDVMINCTPITTSSTDASACCFTLDVSDRAAAERTQALLAAVVESSDDAIVTKDLTGVVTSWNAGAQRVFGYTSEEAVGRNISFIIPPDRLGDEDLILSMIGRGEFVPAFETVRRRKDGTLIPISVSVSPVRDASGRVIGASKMARDISARIRMEADLREAARRKDEFLATLAHELRNPLAPMRHALHLLAALEPDSQRISHVLGILTRQLDQMVRLIDDLMDVSRIDRNKLDLRRSPVELSTLVRQAVETARPLMDAARHTLSVEIPEQPIFVDVDAVRIAQVLANLLSNAAKFTNPGGIITIEAAQVGTALQLRITDNGLGIPAERLESLFELFAQGHDRAEDSRGGLGIGLTLVRRIVELHGGRTYLQSAGVGTGTTAVVELPLGARAAINDPGRQGLTPAGQLHGRTILVVDDIRDNADTLGALLTVLGGDVTTCYDGAAAVAAFAAEPRDIVLLDLGMPTLNGFDACRAIRQLPRGDDALIVALTGWGQPTDRQRSDDAGFDAHLVKPVDLPLLLDLLNDLLANRAAGGPP